MSSITESRSYNTRNQLTGISATAGSNLLSLTYDYGTTNNIGRIRTRTDALQPEYSVNYTYDAMNRLSQVGAANGSWSVGWTVDAWGNRTAQTLGGLATSRVGTQTLGYVNNRNTLFNYDNDGNVTNDGLHNYTYDAEGRITTADGGAVIFGYDAEGWRLKKTANSETTYFMYGQTGLMSEFSTANTNAAQAASTDRLNYFVSEQTGTPVLALTGSGTVREDHRVLPYGEIWNPESGSSNDQKFTTYLRDSATDLDYAMARFYASRYGEFMSPDMSGTNIDPTNPQSWNAYAYVNGDPINFTDPSGEGLFGFLIKLAGVVVSFFNPGLGAAIVGSSIGFGHVSIGGTPPFNPSAQNAPVGVFGTPSLSGNPGKSPISTGVFQPPAIARPQLIFDAVVPYISQDRFEQGLPSWLPGWSKALLWGIFSDPTPGLFAGGLFEKAGIATTQHFRGRLIGRAARGITEAGALDAYRNGRLYYDPVSRNFIRHSSRTGISVVTDAASGGRVITVFEGRPSPNWNPVPWRPGQ